MIKRRTLMRRLIYDHRHNRHLIMKLIMRLLVWSFTMKLVRVLRWRWVGRTMGKLVVERQGGLSVLVARSSWWQYKGRIVGKLILMWLDRKLVLVERWVADLMRRRMKG